MHLKPKPLTGWTTKFDEIYNGFFKVTLVDNYGRKAEVIEDPTEKTIDKTLSYAFEIEKRVSNNWNKFLHNFWTEV